MSHTFHGIYATFHHNSDLSGEVRIFCDTTGNAVDVDMDDLLDFVAEIVRKKKISELEQASTERLLGIRKPK